MSGFSGGIGSPAWFYGLIMVAQKWLPEIKASHPNDSREWLLAKALSVAWQSRQAQDKEAGNVKSQAQIEGGE